MNENSKNIKGSVSKRGLTLVVVNLLLSLFDLLYE